MEYQKVVLDNGLCIITCPMPHTRSVSVVFFLIAGSCYEDDKEAGISHFVEHMCFKGTGKRQSSQEISEAIEGVGGILNGGTDREMTTYWCKLASQHFELAVDVIVDLLRNPLLRKEDVDKERQVIIEEINMSLDSPQQRVGMLYDELMWPGKPLGRDVAGSKETVSSITRQQMSEYLKNYYAPDNMLVSIAGDFQPDKAVEIIERAIGNWTKGKSLDYIPSSTGQESARVQVEHRDTEQVNLVLGLEGLSIFHPDRFILDILSIMLGEGMSSRLFSEIREKLGLAYDIHSYVEHFRDTGAFIIQAGVEPGQTGKAISAILTQLGSIKENISDFEMHKAREMAKGRLLLSMENSRNVAGWYGAQEVLTRRIITIDAVTRIIEKISADDLKRVARSLFLTERLNLAVVGPVEKPESLAEILRL